MVNIILSKYVEFSSSSSSSAATSRFSLTSGSLDEVFPDEHILPTSNLKNPSFPGLQFAMTNVSLAIPDGHILPTSNLKIFSFAELKYAARNFEPDMVIGEGRFGRFFKGCLDETYLPSNIGTGMVIAVKKLKPERLQGLEEWQAHHSFSLAQMVNSIFARNIDISSGSSNSSSSGGTATSWFSAASGDEVFPYGHILPTPNLKIFSFTELSNATRNFSSDMVIGEGGFGKVFKGWLDEKTYAPSIMGTRMTIAVKKFNQKSLQGLEQWQAIHCSANLVAMQGFEMEKGGAGTSSLLLGTLGSLMRKCLFSVLSVGPIPNHIAFILDGNRRYARKWKLKEGGGHRVGFLALMSLLKYCYELGVKYVTIYAFSIDNFNRKPNEVKYVMDLMQEKIEGLLKEENILRRYGVRVYFVGKLSLLSDPVRIAAEKAMLATADNTNAVLLVCVAYTSTNEIVHAIAESYKEKQGKSQDLNSNGVCSNEGVGVDETDQEKNRIKLSDLEKHMYMAVAPDPDILVRTSGETRLSNFLMWQSTYCHLYSPEALWPEIGLQHLVWSVLVFQRHHSYMEKKKKQL
ncbi:hypothetical protein HHK36_030818 [Tetracentron sinense]|uniref:Alkyl transferase n=1 Tax=Tetracentron sinense TaxID=13715 RepID=A0A835D124_TETSI|nr:hypothetical protein HHK36_030818 [Tetracentron sinense]